MIKSDHLMLSGIVSVSDNFHITSRNHFICGNRKTSLEKQLEREKIISFAFNGVLEIIFQN